MIGGLESLEGKTNGRDGDLQSGSLRKNGGLRGGDGVAGKAIKATDNRVCKKFGIYIYFRKNQTYRWPNKIKFVIQSHH